MGVDFGDTVRKHYDLDVDTLEAVAEAVADMGEAATIEWFPTYDYTATHGILDSADVTVTTIVTLPRWTGYSAANETERREWDRFCAALRAHAQGHVDLVVRHLSGIDERLAGVSVARAKLVWDHALSTLCAASQDYDRRTEHGRRHGGVIDAEWCQLLAAGAGRATR